MCNNIGRFFNYYDYGNIQYWDYIEIIVLVLTTILQGVTIFREIEYEISFIPKQYMYIYNFLKFNILMLEVKVAQEVLHIRLMWLNKTYILLKAYK